MSSTPTTRGNGPDGPDSTGQPPDKARTQGRRAFSRYARTATLCEVNSEFAGPALDARHYDVLLSATPRAARLARLLAIEQLRGWGLPLDAPRVIVAELAANAVTHGRVPGRGFRLELLARPGLLRIEVADTRGDRLPVMRAPGGAGADRRVRRPVGRTGRARAWEGGVGGGLLDRC